MSEISEPGMAFISYKDEYGKVISGYFQLLLQNNHIVKFRSNRNTFTIPIHRILKVKESNDQRGGHNS